MMHEKRITSALPNESAFKPISNDRDRYYPKKGLALITTYTRNGPVSAAFDTRIRFHHLDIEEAELTARGVFSRPQKGSPHRHWLRLGSTAIKSGSYKAHNADFTSWQLPRHTAEELSLNVKAFWYVPVVVKRGAIYIDLSSLERIPG
jgi:hypothetical protein